ncbi:MAG: C4-type zinc ribbon domain-containing protein [Bacteroidota bacterium]
MATKKELTVEEKLRQLYELQLIDNELTELTVLKGELPMEVKDLEDEIEGLETRHARLQRNVEDQESEIARHRANIEEANNLIIRYNSQLDNVKNNREYEALTKELEMQKLEIQLSEKRIGEAEVIIGTKKETQEETKVRLDQKKVDLERKKVELEKITEDTEKQEKKLIKESETLRKRIEERLLKAYDRVRTNYRNGLAVVPVQRNSCGGCFNNVPPQMQLEIGMRKKIIVCEHCGRILVDENILEESALA